MSNSSLLPLKNHIEEHQLILLECKDGSKKPLLTIINIIAFSCHNYRAASTTNTNKIDINLNVWAIWKSQDQYLAISIDIDIGLAIGMEKNLIMAAWVFKGCSENFWKLPGKTSTVEPFLSTSVGLPGSFPKIHLEQLFCRESASTCFCKKGIPWHVISQIFWNLKNRQGLTRQSVGIKKELHYRALPGDFAKVSKLL